MEEMLAGAGILCIAAAVMTRQLKAAGRNIPVLISSTRRQALLAALGAVLLGASFLTRLVDPSAQTGTFTRGTITPPHATDAPPSVSSDSSGGNAPQMSGQGASSEGPGPSGDHAIERSDHPDSAATVTEDELRSRSRERKREP
jgi:hypothetical protein